MIGTKVANYEITAHLGSGGLGDVYQATDSKLAPGVSPSNSFLKLSVKTLNAWPDSSAKLPSRWPR